MRKSLTTNNFKNGLIMDTNPMEMPNTAYINGLNVTLITKDGNEHILQNDMGNGRVETAYLPEGYIPLGTCSLGGIIYVASYNPLKDKGLIGCFPSPERNISSDEDSELNVELTNDDFQFKPDEINGFTSSIGAETYYLKKQLWADKQFNPGDKFIVYGSPISGNFEKLWIEREYVDLLNYVKDDNPNWKPNLKLEEETEPGPEIDPMADIDEGSDEGETDEEKEEKRKLNWANSIWELIKTHTVKLSIGTITNTGKLIVFSNLKEYNTNNTSPKMSDGETTYPYLIFEYSTPDNLKKTDLDDYRSLVSQPYNVFNSKISGQLVLIAELVQFNDFDMTIKNNMGEDEDGHKTYEPIFNFNYEGDYPYIPYGAECEFLMTWKNSPIDLDSGDIGTEFKDYNCYNDEDDNLVKSDFCKNNGLIYKSYQLEDPFTNSEVLTDIGKELSGWSSTGFFDNKERNSGGKIRYKIKPSMIWGPVSYLEVDGLIDLDKIGTGYIGITQWRYYNDDNKCTLNWGLETYEEDGYQVSSVVMRMSRLTGYNRINGYSVEMIDYFVDTYDSYFGTFTEQIPLDSEYFKIKQIAGFNNTDPNDKDSDKDPDNPIYGESYYNLKSNQLYLVDIRVVYDKIDPDDGEEDNSTVRHFYRWLFTSPVLNNYYGRSQDFCKEYLEFDIDFATTVTNSFFETGISGAHYGHIFDKTDSGDYSDSDSSHSIYQHDYNIGTTADVLVKLTSDYNMFYLDVSTDENSGNLSPFDVTVEYGGVDVSDVVKSSYLGSDDPQRSEYLTNSTLYVGEDVGDNIENYYYDNYIAKEGNDDVFKISSTVFELDKDKEAKDTTCSDGSNTIKIDLTSELLLTIRAYCTKQTKTINVNSSFRPLAYNVDTFSEYGLEWCYFSGPSEIHPSLVNSYCDPHPKIQEKGPCWNAKKIGLWGTKEKGGEKGRSYVNSISRDGTYSDNNQKRIEKVNNVGFHFQSKEKVALAWLDLGITLPISFLLFYYGTKYTDASNIDHLKMSGANSDNTNTEDDPVNIGCAQRYYSYKRLGLFFAMRDETGSYYQIPLNLFLCISFKSNFENYFSYSTYPGCFSYFGLPHIIALWLNNIYMWDNTGTTFLAYVPNGIYWEDEYVSNISILVEITIKSDELNKKIVLIKLDDGTLVDLRDIKDIFIDAKLDSVLLISTGELKKEDWEEEDKDEPVLILDPNTQYTIKSSDQYSTSINIVKSDTTSGDIMRDEMASMQNVVLNGTIFDYDGTTILADSCETKKDKTSLYMRDDSNGVAFVTLASKFVPYEISYNEGTGNAEGLKLDNNNELPIPLDSETGINLNSYFVINNGLIYLKEGHTGQNGDIRINLKRKNDDQGAYVTGIVDIPILPVYSYKSS